MSENGKKEIGIFDLINPFYAQALASLKLIEIPEMKMELDLESAKFAIDCLELINKKMAGNLSSEEAKIIEDIVGGLKYQYIEIENQGKENFRKEEK